MDFFNKKKNYRVKEAAQGDKTEEKISFFEKQTEEKHSFLATSDEELNQRINSKSDSSSAKNSRPSHRERDGGNRNGQQRNNNHRNRNYQGKKRNNNQRRVEYKKKKPSVSIIPIGGLGEIGKNMTAIKYGNNIIVIDCGMKFPDDSMLGVDTVIPDYTYLQDNAAKIKAIVLTHGHEDHIGSLPYVLRDLKVPVYGTRLTLGQVRHKLKEAKISAELHEVKPGDVVNLPPFKAEFIHVNHSIVDACGIAITTPAGVIVHTGDFKIDLTPVDGRVIDLARFCELGNEGVLALLSDSTNAEVPGFTKSESIVGGTFDDAFKVSRGRIIVATFATNVHRIQQVLNTAAKYNRKVAIVGRSMVNMVNVAAELDCLKVPKNTLIDIESIDSYPGNKVVILATGSQGEPMSTLTRIANSEHKQISIIPGDTIIVSAKPIPGNEVSVAKNVDMLFRKGALVYYENDQEIHVSGHARQEELKLMISMVKPKYFVPVHGEFRMLCKHGELARGLGIDSKNIFIMDNGQVLELNQDEGKIKGTVTSGQIMIDGMGSEDVGNIVLRDRRLLANDGIMVVIITVDKNGCLVASPEVISRGFIYIKEAENLMYETKAKVRETMAKYEGQRICEFSVVKQDVKDNVSKILYNALKRKPMIIPVIVEID